MIERKYYYDGFEIYMDKELIISVRGLKLFKREMGSINEVKE